MMKEKIMVTLGGDGGEEESERKRGQFCISIPLPLSDI